MLNISTGASKRKGEREEGKTHLRFPSGPVTDVAGANDLRGKSNILPPTYITLPLLRQLKGSSGKLSIRARPALRASLIICQRVSNLFHALLGSRVGTLYA